MTQPAGSVGRPAGPDPTLGRPRRHLRRCDSTNERARRLALDGAPHGTLVTAAEQTAGRGRQGRSWHAPPGQALLLSLVLRHWPPLLPLAAAVAVAELAGSEAKIKWPNDVLVEGRKLSGILVEGRPTEGWAVLGIGLNVALDPAQLPPEVAAIAASLRRAPEELEPTLGELLGHLEHWLGAGDRTVLDAVRARDGLRGRVVSAGRHRGEAAGIDDRGRLVIRTPAGEVAVGSGEVHLGTLPA